MTDTAGVSRKRDGGEAGRRPLIDEELADRLLDRAQAEGAELPGPDGCCPRWPGPCWNGRWLRR
jgi:hypothetical protein